MIITILISGCALFIGLTIGEFLLLKSRIREIKKAHRHRKGIPFEAQQRYLAEKWDQQHLFDEKK